MAELTREKLYLSLRSILRYHKEIGIDSYPCSESLRNFLAYSPVPEDFAAPVDNSPSPIVDMQGAGVAAKGCRVDKGTISEINDEIVKCTACRLREKRVVAVPGRGGQGGCIRLLIIGGWLQFQGQETSHNDTLFGREEDEMVVRMLTAITLPPEQVFITNVIKCGLDMQTQPKAENVNSCMSYLRRQIEVLQPEFICTMGMIAAKAVIGTSLPLSRLRGRFHNYATGSKKTIPVLATYHPDYLLQNPEMKRAAWADLQLLGRKMGLKF